MKKLLFLFLFAPFLALTQMTTVKGTVADEKGEPISFARVRFVGTKIGTLTDSLGGFFLQSYYATDSIQVQFIGYKTKTIKIKKDVEQNVKITMMVQSTDYKDVVVLISNESPAVALHKKVIANKPINNKEKLDAYQYNLYNKIQLDLNNLGDKFQQNGLVKRMDLVMNYLDSSSDGNTYLPVILSESISDFYFKNHPKQKKEIVQATKITGLDNVQVNQFLGDMYLDLNVYDNIYDLFNKSFISPLAPFARTYYQFVLEDSSFIDNDWCYKLRFEPKRTGDLAFTGEMWINDTTYAVKQIKASISPDANLNYIQNFYFEHFFDQVQNEVWMLNEERLIIEFRLTEESKILGMFGRKYSKRSDFVINQAKDNAFYSTNSVEISDSAKLRSTDYWVDHRPVTLNVQEKHIEEMVDSLSKTTFYKSMKKLLYFATTGYYPWNKIEIGNATSLISKNPVENYRVALALRTSNDFSHRLELGGRAAYGFGDEKFKYAAKIRYNITPKKRGMLTGIYSYDIEQIGQSPTAASMGSTFATVFNTAPFDKLTFVNKVGLNLEKDVKKDIILYGGFEWKSYTPLGLANYTRVVSNDTVNVSNIKTFEFIGRFRWTKGEEFLSGYFDRTSLRSVYPIFSIQAIIGMKNIFGSEYNYQRLEFQMEHNTQLGVLGRMRYGVTAGYIFGTTAYPFLKVHEGNQSLWLLTSTFNKLNFMEFISDKYITGFIENHWEGLFFDRIPLVKKLNLRLVSTGRILYGDISQKHEQAMLIPDFVKRFNGIPYIETSIGIENIFKVVRVDLVWRMTHPIPGESPFGIRARYALNF
ncbi:MAG: hypothetical protein RJB36_1014 [Bacteroidota bacterium]